MKALIVLTFDVPTAEHIATALREIDPPRLQHFSGSARVVPDPYATQLTAWLDNDADDAQIAPADDGVRDRATTILLYAFRYALGRQTYAVSEVAQALTAAAVSLPASTRGLIISEIEEAINTNRAGAPTDTKTWTALAERLRAAGEDENP